MENFMYFCISIENRTKKWRSEYKIMEQRNGLEVILRPKFTKF